MPSSPGLILPIPPLMTRLVPRKPLHLAVLTSVCVLLFALFIPVQTAAASGNTSSDYVSRINALRAAVHVQPLLVDGELTGLAQAWANHMASTGVLSHSSLTAGITEPWGKLGENVGVGPDNPTIWNAFLHSAEHYANLVDPAYNRVGVGVAFGGGSEWTCHKFMDLVGAPAPPPTSPPVVYAPPPPPVFVPAPPVTSGAGSRVTPTTAGAGTGGATTTTVGPAPQAGPPPPASSQRVAAVLAALRRLSP
jgi:hypothetical protein